MKILDRSNVIYKMDKNNEPVIKITSGDTILVRTYDCFKNQLIDSEVTFDDIDFNSLNPATGPIFVEGAMPQDTLKIEIIDIKVDEIGCTEIDHTFGVLKNYVKEPSIRRIRVESEKIIFSENLVMKYYPMIGVIGVAPPLEGIGTDTPGNHGGNMDCTLITTGAALYLPVSVPGALLALGDLHACMGDGEIGGCGLEISGTVTMRITVIKELMHPFPVLIDKNVVCVIASEPTIEIAWETATKYMYDLLNRYTKMNSEEVIMLQSLAANLVICQTVNPMKTVRMTFPLDYASAYGYKVF